jgi:hypothetical protein
LNSSLIRLSSVTYAIRAQKQLERHGIKSYIRKQQIGKNTRGCGYGVEIHSSVSQPAQDIIRAAGIRIYSVE